MESFAGKAEHFNVFSRSHRKDLNIAFSFYQQPREKPVYNIRKPGEGDSAAKIGKLVLKKKEDDLADEEEEYETDEVSSHIKDSLEF